MYTTYSKSIPLLLTPGCQSVALLFLSGKLSDESLFF